MTASPFSAGLQTIQESASLHGIVVFGLSLDEYKTIVLRHIFAGACVSGPDTKGCFACSHFAQGFTSAQEMIHSAFKIIGSATSS